MAKCRVILSGHFLTMATDKGAGGSWSQSGSFRTRLLTDILAGDAAHVDELTVMLLKLYGRSHQEWREYNVWRQYGAAPKFSFGEQLFGADMQKASDMARTFACHDLV